MNYGWRRWLSTSWCQPHPKIPAEVTTLLRTTAPPTTLPPTTLPPTTLPPTTLPPTTLPPTTLPPTTLPPTTLPPTTLPPTTLPPTTLPPPSWPTGHGGVAPRRWILLMANLSDSPMSLVFLPVCRVKYRILGQQKNTCWWYCNNWWFGACWFGFLGSLMKGIVT